MEKLLFASFVILSLAACKATSVDKKDDVINYKETVTINDVPKATLTFFEVSDSRCPEGVQCIWAGNAKIDLQLDGATTEGHITEHVNMCLGSCNVGKSGNFKTADTLDHEFSGQKYRFILDAVNRPAKADSATGKSYSISLRIEKK